MNPQSKARRRVLAALVFAGAGVTAIAQAGHKPVDFNGDGRSDYAVVRNTGGGSGGAVTWFVIDNATGTFSHQTWGISTDYFVPGDYDGDNKADAAIYRPGAPGTAGFWIKRSSDGVTIFQPFGFTGDDPTVVGDYDGDGKTDIAVYRGGASAGQPSFWWVRRSSDGAIVGTQWGQNADFPAPGDYDGDGAHDYAIQRNAGGGQAVFWLKQSTAGVSTVFFGTSSDAIAPGDYDGDGKTDLMVLRDADGAYNWWLRRSSNGSVAGTAFGLTASDFVTQGDYDGDGKTDIAVWRPSVTPNTSAFWVLRSTGGVFQRPWGAHGDYPVANGNTH